MYMFYIQFYVGNTMEVIFWDYEVNLGQKTRSEYIETVYLYDVSESVLVFLKGGTMVCPSGKRICV